MLVPDIDTQLAELTALGRYLLSKGKTRTAQMVLGAKSALDVMHQELERRKSQGIKSLAEELALALQADIETAMKEGLPPPRIKAVQLIYEKENEKQEETNGN